MPEDPETPLQELLRTAREASAELYYVRSDASYRIPYGVMQRLKKALERMDVSRDTHPPNTKN